ncbi:MAG TPA: ATP-binding protein [Ignavibacteria bacterium]|nr:ATP-binding protein [Ignavibacteria bacterium]HMR41073.1 ATP-binding protein [Ignavibacteria bacterium]
MEDMVTSALRKQEDYLRKTFSEKYKIPESEIDKILIEVESVINQMVVLVKEGKSAHEKFFSYIILNSIDAIIGFDNDQKIFLWNKGAENIFGYKKSEITGKDFSILVPEDLIKKGEVDFLVNEVKTKGFLANHETERITKDGNRINVSITRFVVSNEEEEMIGSVGIVRDITVIKNLEKELREKEKLALIGEVVSSIAHNLSNPLNIISGNADYLLLDKKVDDPEYEELKTILDEATRITKSIRHLLNFSRPLHTEKNQNDINELLHSVATGYRHLNLNKEIKFKKNLHKDIPLFKFDRFQLEDVFSNLINNAVQAIPQKGEIKINSSYENNNVIVEISDNGSGIVKENLENIFLPFYSSKDYGKGTGLGLAIAKRIVNEHKGEILVESKVGKGTKFTLVFPVNN